MNRALAYRVQMMPATVRESSTKVVTALLNCGWPQDEINEGVDGAIAWANSHCMTARQDKLRRSLQMKKDKLSSADALDVMFTASGVDPHTIPAKGN